MYFVDRLIVSAPSEIFEKQRNKQNDTSEKAREINGNEY